MYGEDPRPADTSELITAAVGISAVAALFGGWSWCWRSIVGILAFVGATHLIDKWAEAHEPSANVFFTAMKVLAFTVVVLLWTFPIWFALLVGWAAGH